MAAKPKRAKNPKPDWIHLSEFVVVAKALHESGLQLSYRDRIACYVLGGACGEKYAVANLTDSAHALTTKQP